MRTNASSIQGHSVWADAVLQWRVNSDRLNDFSLSPLQHVYANWNVAIERAGENQVRLNLTMKDTTNVARFTIDTARHVLLKHEVMNDGKVTNTTSFDNFVELADT